MCVLRKLIDATLFLFFLFIAIIVIPIIDAQICLPQHLFPTIMVELKNWYTHEYNDYLVSEKPHFFLGIVWLKLVFLWPLSIACMYGIVAGKSNWFNTACLIHGVSTATSMVAILSELTLSERASDQLLMIYFSFLGFSLLVFLRGLLTHSGNNATIAKRNTAANRKKRA